MTYGTNDLAPLLTPPPSQSLRYAQAVIREWNPDTAANRIEWRGVTLENVPVLAGVDALGFTPGTVVGLLGWTAPGGGMGSWWILGRVVVPGSSTPDLLVRGSVIRVEDTADDRFVELTAGLIGFGPLGQSATAFLAAVNQDIVMQANFNAFMVGDNQAVMQATNGNAAVTAGGQAQIQAGSHASLNSTSGSVFLNADDQVQILSGDNAVFIDHGTTGSSANAHLATNGLLSRSTSSRRYKVDIEDYRVDPKAVLDLTPRTWRDRGEVEADPETDRWHVGFVAEEVHKAGLTGFVEYDDQGRPDAVAYDRLSVALLAVAKDQEARLAAIEARLGIAAPASAETTVKPARRPARPAARDDRPAAPPNLAPEVTTRRSTR